VILGKIRRWRGESLQLMARTAVAAALWHATEEPRPLVLMVASDAPDVPPDADRVAARLASLGVPSASIRTRRWSNCTLLEARSVRVLARREGLESFTVLTHPYHRPRAQRIFGEVLSRAEVRAVEPRMARDLARRAGPGDLVGEVAASMPGRFDAFRETIVEWILRGLHRIDPRGRIERSLVRLLRTPVVRLR
jgi:uncharacterized SAM-binding protein YcdF (DUF218 family)